MTMPAQDPVTTESGQVLGVPSLLEGVTVYKGIPYAAPPIGELRWRSPQPAAAWSGVRVADAFGPICPQTPHDLGDLPMSEDCLSLNIWTTTVPGPPRPVYVWIHGGRFTFGAGREPMFDGAALAAKGLVVVTLNYRTGSFGFLATKELSAESGHGASGNYGLLDQIAALRWIQRNIEAFGGDPGRVTIGGQSAGAASVMCLVYSPLTRGAVHGVIAESGALHPRDPSLEFLAAAYRQLPNAEQEGRDYLRRWGVSSLDELRALPTERLMEGIDADEPGKGDHRPPLYRPVLDGWVFPKSYEQMLTEGIQNDVPVMTGTNLDEDGATPQPSITLTEYLSRAQEQYGELTQEYLGLYPAADDGQARQQANAAARDWSRTSTYLWSRLWGEHASHPVYTYFWTHAVPGETKATRGAYHSSEVNYFFGNLYATNKPWENDDHRIADIMSSYVTAFVTSGDPNAAGLPEWTPPGEGAPTTMEIGDHFGRIPVAEPAKLDFWRRFFATQPSH